MNFFSIYMDFVIAFAKNTWTLYMHFFLQFNIKILLIHHFFSDAMTLHGLFLHIHGLCHCIYQKYMDFIHAPEYLYFAQLMENKFLKKYRIKKKHPKRCLCYFRCYLRFNRSKRSAIQISFHQ